MVGAYKLPSCGSKILFLNLTPESQYMGVSEPISRAPILSYYVTPILTPILTRALSRCARPPKAHHVLWVCHVCIFVNPNYKLLWLWPNAHARTLTYARIGAYLAAKQPRHVIGVRRTWLGCLQGMLFTTAYSYTTGRQELKWCARPRQQQNKCIPESTLTFEFESSVLIISPYQDQICRTNFILLRSAEQCSRDHFLKSDMKRGFCKKFLKTWHIINRWKVLIISL